MSTRTDWTAIYIYDDIYTNMASTLDLNTEKFIEDVFERPGIWNRNYQGNKSLIDETWDELSGIHNISGKNNAIRKRNKMIKVE